MKGWNRGRLVHKKPRESNERPRSCSIDHRVAAGFITPLPPLIYPPDSLSVISLFPVSHCKQTHQPFQTSFRSLYTVLSELQRNDYLLEGKLFPPIATPMDPACVGNPNLGSRSLAKNNVNHFRLRLCLLGVCSNSLD